MSVHGSNNFNGSMIIIRDIPEGYEFGIDFNNWIITSLFLGVKCIPSGSHIIFVSSVKKHERSPRNSHVVYLNDGDILCFKWTKTHEYLEQCLLSDESKISLKEEMTYNINRLYDYQKDKLYSKWSNLTNFINCDVVNKLRLDNSLPMTATTNVPPNYLSKKTYNEAMLDKQIDTYNDSNPNNIHDLTNKDVINFSTFPSNEHYRGLDNNKITQLHLDWSSRLEYIIYNQVNSYKNSPKKPSDKDDNILGEYQYAFISFIIGEVYAAFDHWKALTLVFCHSISFIKDHLGLYSKFCDVIRYQILELPMDYIVDIVKNENFIYISLKTLFKNVQQVVDRQSNNLQYLEQKLVNSINQLVECVQVKLECHFSWFPSDSTKNKSGNEIISVFSNNNNSLVGTIELNSDDEGEFAPVLVSNENFYV